jgi:anthranilate synthase component 2
MKRVLLIDNYDSFTYNLVQLVRESGVSHELSLIRNDADPADFVMHFDKVILSPGPGLPDESGNLMQFIAEFAGITDLLGICLGHQALAMHFGAKLRQSKHPAHGIASTVNVCQADTLFKDMPSEFVCGRYHSWVIDEASLPSCLEITARDEAGNIMSVRHKTLLISGLQFHPESYITQHGMMMIRNWLLRDTEA